MIVGVVGLVGVACAAGACKSDRPARDRRRELEVAVAPSVPVDPLVEVRQHMVEDTIVARGIRDPAVIDAMRTVPRHEMVPPEIRGEAYDDRALPIGFGLTISQPYIVAMMTEAAHVDKGDRVLEIGTGSGYQAAVLAELGAKVYTIEIHEELAARTRKVLSIVGYDQVQLKVGDGYYGWPDAAPFDAILVTAAAPEVPPPLLEQLRTGGRIVIPLGDDIAQSLFVVTKHAGGTTTRDELLGVRFGPMLGKARDDAEP